MSNDAGMWLADKLEQLGYGVTISEARGQRAIVFTIDTGVKIEQYTIAWPNRMGMAARQYWLCSRYMLLGKHSKKRRRVA